MGGSTRDFISDELLLDELEAGTGDSLASELVAAIGAERSTAPGPNSRNHKVIGGGTSFTGSKRPSWEEPPATNSVGSEALPAQLERVCEIVGETTQHGRLDTDTPHSTFSAQQSSCESEPRKSVSTSRGCHASDSGETCGNARRIHNRENESALLREKLFRLSHICELMHASPDVFACALARLASNSEELTRNCIIPHLIDASMWKENALPIRYLRACIATGLVRGVDVVQLFINRDTGALHNCSMTFLIFIRDILQFYTFRNGDSEECESFLDGLTLLAESANQRNQARELLFSLLTSHRVIALARISARRARAPWARLQQRLREIPLAEHAESVAEDEFDAWWLGNGKKYVDVWLERAPSDFSFLCDMRNSPNANVELRVVEMIENMNRQYLIPNEVRNALIHLCQTPDIGLGIQARCFKNISDAFLLDPERRKRGEKRLGSPELLLSLAEAYSSVITAFCTGARNAPCEIPADPPTSPHSSPKAAPNPGSGEMVQQNGLMEGSREGVIQHCLLKKKQEIAEHKQGRSYATRSPDYRSQQYAEFCDFRSTRLRGLGARVLPAVLRKNEHVGDFCMPLTIAFAFMLCALSDWMHFSRVKKPRSFVQAPLEDNQLGQSLHGKIATLENGVRNCESAYTNREQSGENIEEGNNKESVDADPKCRLNRCLLSDSGSDEIARDSCSKMRLSGKIALDIARLAISLMQYDIHGKRDSDQKPRLSSFGLTGAFMVLFLAQIPKLFRSVTEGIVRELIFAIHRLMVMCDHCDGSSREDFTYRLNSADELTEDSGTISSPALITLQKIQFLVLENADLCGILGADGRYLRELSEFL